MPNTFTTPGTTVRKVDITQVFNAWTSGSATYGVPVNMAVSSALTALKIRQNGAGNIAEFLKSDGSVVFSIDNAGSVSGLSFAAGSETNPSVYLNGDTDTGLWQPDVDEIAISIGGTKKIHLAGGSLEFLDTILINQGTLTSDAQGIRHTAVWDEGTTTFTSMEVVITDNDSASASLLLDLQCGASPASVFSVRKDGLVTAAGVTLASGSLVFSAAAGKIVPGATSLSLRNNADGADNLLITDAGLATFRNTVTAAALTVSDGTNGLVLAGGSTGDLYLRPKDSGHIVRMDTGSVVVSGPLNVNGALTVGTTTPATAGDVRFPNNGIIAWRRAGSAVNHKFYLNGTDALTYDNGSTNLLQILATGDIVGSLGVTTMTDGFLYIPAATGAVTGVPTNRNANRVPLYYDTTGNRLYIYSGASGGWKSVALA